MSKWRTSRGRRCHTLGPDLYARKSPRRRAGDRKSKSSYLLGPRVHMLQPCLREPSVPHVFFPFAMFDHAAFFYIFIGSAAQLGQKRHVS
jgi:hypothetical protein